MMCDRRVVKWQLRSDLGREAHRFRLIRMVLFFSFQAIRVEDDSERRVIE